MGRRHGAKYFVNTAGKEFVFVTEMHIKGGSADVGAIEDFLNCDRVVILFANW